MNINNKAEFYEQEILQYLENKYNEKFEIDVMTRQTDIGQPSVINARVCSERFPKEYFDVEYHLSSQDIENKEEILETLREIDVYDESKIRLSEENVESYLQDNYANIIFQHQYDDVFCDFDATYVKTMFETTNYFPDEQDSRASLNEFLDSEKYPLYSCTMIFVDENMVDDKEVYVKEIVGKLSRKSIDMQFIYFHFTDKDKGFLENEFYENYDNAVKYFMNAPFLTDYIDVFLEDGQPQ